MIPYLCVSRHPTDRCPVCRTKLPPAATILFADAAALIARAGAEGLELSYKARLVHEAIQLWEVCAVQGYDPAMCSLAMAYGASSNPYQRSAKNRCPEKSPAKRALACSIFS